MTKLLLISSEFPPQPGGIGVHAYNVATELSKNKFQTTVLTDSRSSTGNVEDTFDDIQNYRVVRVLRRKPIFITYLNRIYLTLKLLPKNDVILVSGKFSLWLAGIISLVSKKKIIAVVHGSELLLKATLQRNYTNWCLSKCDTIIAVSNYTRSLLTHLPVKKCVVIPNGYALNSNIKTKTPKKLHANPLNIITVGNLTQRKGQHNVIAALPTLQKKFPNIQYHMAGLPTEKDRLLQVAKELKVEKHCVFHGRVSEEKKIDLLQNATIFVMLSEATLAGDVEGFGIAIIEANSLGVPAIGAKGCGIEDAIQEGMTGFTVPHNDINAFIKALETILNNYETFSEAAIAWSETLHWEKVIQRYISIIQEIS